MQMQKNQNYHAVSWNQIRIVFFCSDDVLEDVNIAFRDWDNILGCIYEMQKKFKENAYIRGVFT